MKLNKKSSVTLYLVFLVVGIMIILIAAFAAPLGILINTQLFLAGEQILDDSNSSIMSIKDANVRNSILGTVQSAKDNTENNIEVIGSMYQYAWVVFLVLTAIIIFLYTRSLVEVRGGGLA